MEKLKGYSDAIVIGTPEDKEVKELKGVHKIIITNKGEGVKKLIISKPSGEQYEYIARDINEVLALAPALVSYHYVILINLEIFLEDHLFGRTCRIFDDENEEHKNLIRHVKPILVVSNVISDEEAIKKAKKFSEAANTIGIELNLKDFPVILAETTPRDMVYKVFCKYYSRIAIVVGSNLWVRNYLKELQKIKEPSIGVVVEVSPLSSETFNFAQNEFLAAISAVENSGKIPENVATEFGVQQQGEVIWARKVTLRGELGLDNEELSLFQKRRKLLAELFSDT
jgi:hypothetical protein